MGKIEKIKIKRKYSIIVLILLLLLFWISMTTIVLRFKNPELTETELFLRIPKSFILDYE